MRASEPRPSTSWAWIIASRAGEANARRISDHHGSGSRTPQRATVSSTEARIEGDSDSYHPRIDRVTTAGVVTRFPITGGGYHSSTDITAGPDGNLWFTDPGANAVGMITTEGAVQEFALPTETAYPFDIAAGSDGAMWFTEFSAGKIGRITV